MESGESESKSQSSKQQRRVGILYDEKMCKHHTPDDHPENPNRITAIWNKLLANNIPQRCVVLNGKEADDKALLAVHSKNHVNLIRNISSKKFGSRRDRIASKFNSIYFNDGSSEAAYLAAGSVIEVAEKVAEGELDSAAAIVRPPGHHAEHGEPMGFCLFNNVAVATSFLLDEKPELGIKKILIVDWDVHHGNGTQKMFWKDPRVLFFSVHRHEFGRFYPANDDGFYTMIGEGAGAGYNINVPWVNGRCGDADYFAVWDHILIPVAKEFDPDIIIVSAGFDAAVGDPLGGCRVTPYGYSVMLKKLMDFANGKIVLALEGGYNLDSIASSFLACMEVLLESKPVAGSSEAYPFESTWSVIQAVRKELSAYWPTLADEIPLKLISQKAPPAHLLISSSDSEDEDVGGHDQLTVKPIPPGRSELSKTNMMAAYFAFADGLLLDDEQETHELAQERETSIVPIDATLGVGEDLVVDLTQKETTESSRKRPWDDEADEEELIEGSGLFVKRPRIPGCSDMRKWIMQNMSPPSILNTQVRDQYVESLRFPADILRWMVIDKDDLPNALISHTLELAQGLLLAKDNQYFLKSEINLKEEKLESIGLEYEGSCKRRKRHLNFARLSMPKLDLWLSRARRRSRSLH